MKTRIKKKPEPNHQSHLTNKRKTHNVESNINKRKLSNNEMTHEHFKGHTHTHKKRKKNRDQRVRAKLNARIKNTAASHMNCMKR